MRNLLHDAWERFLLSLPLMVMGALALGTYWLVRSTPAVEAARPERARGHEPDYFMRQFSIKTYDALGRLRSEVQGEEARHYPDTRWVEIDGIHIRSFDTEGRLTTATARQGMTNDGATEVKLMGNAVVVREAQPKAGGSFTPRVEYRGEFLHAFMDTEVVKSNQPVELLRGKDRFTANAMEFDNGAQTLELRGRVRGTLVPTPP
ncbi:MAG: LPS export ABC transporter periplasmic protein LptC [Rhodoferax sp.]|nr:LPS export ABC transporter periplasmic protein LptC [Rhodoferax sp.]